MKTPLDLIKQFCYIQLQVLKDREMRLRKELQECKIQQEFLTGIIEDISEIPSTSDPTGDEN